MTMRADGRTDFSISRLSHAFCARTHENSYLQYTENVTESHTSLSIVK